MQQGETDFVVITQIIFPSIKHNTQLINFKIKNLVNLWLPKELLNFTIKLPTDMWTLSPPIDQFNAYFYLLLYIIHNNKYLPKPHEMHTQQTSKYNIYAIT